MPRAPIKKNRDPGDDYLDTPVSVKLSEALQQKLNEVRNLTGIPVSTQIRRAIEKDLSNSAEPPPPPENTVTIELTPTELSALEKLAKRFGQTDVAGLLKFMAEKAAEGGAVHLHSFLFGDILSGGTTETKAAPGMIPGEAEAVEADRIKRLGRKKQTEAEKNAA